MIARRWTTVDSPLGDLLLVRTDAGLSGLFMSPHQGQHGPPEDGVRDDTAFDAEKAQLAAYFAGELTDFDLVLDLLGTPFQARVWTELQRIPYGTTTSYGEIARALDAPGASRAVGLANGRNPVSVVVPCHRVIGSGGALTGYGGGLPAKRWLLAHETGAGTLL